VVFAHALIRETKIGGCGYNRLSTYYITLSMQMCRSLGAMNSFAYLQCLLSSMWYSAVDRQQFETLRQYPYYSGLEGVHTLLF
jgi:hypothetical protein